MSWNYTAYILDARALLLTERVIVLCVYAAQACLFNYKSDYRRIVSHPSSLASNKCFCNISSWINKTKIPCFFSKNWATFEAQIIIVHKFEPLLDPFFDFSPKDPCFVICHGKTSQPIFGDICLSNEDSMPPPSR